MSGLVIAEKPSVAQAIARVIGATGRHDGYMEGGGYVVSWCFGHLVTLAAADAYDPKYSKWAYEDLPIAPQEWKYIVLPDKEKQLAVLKSLMERGDVTEIIEATDAGREGELIFRLVYLQCGCTKPIKRLWISSMEESAIAGGFQNLRDGAEYENLYQAALCRSKADWLVGINATRLFSVLYRKTLNVGRVMTPTLAMLARREAEIASFQKEPFYTVQLVGGGVTAEGERLADKKEAGAVRDACDGKPATVKAVERREKAEKPPKLYDLTSLQRDANRLLGYTAQQTLDYLQSLYEKKLATYPRTDSRYLTADAAAKVPVLVEAVAALPWAAGRTPTVAVEQVIDDSKVSDHHAVIPTPALAGADLAALPSGERAVLDLIAARLLCAMGEAHVTAETVATLECAGNSFTAKGREILAPGWKTVESAFLATLKTKPKEEKAPALPPLSEGEQISMKAAVREGSTAPPKHFTEDSLLSAMECAGAKDMLADGHRPEDAERKGLGTPATRAATIEKLVKGGFVERKKKQLLPTAKGTALISILPETVTSPQLTAEWEHRLKQVERGELSPDSFMAGIVGMTAELVQTTKEPGDAALFSDREEIGKCPRCGKPVYEGKKNFHCSDRDCSFVMWKDDHFFTTKRKTLTKAVAAALLKKGHVKMNGLYSEKTGKTYDAVVTLADTGGKYVNYRLDFTKEEGRKSK